MNPLLSKQRRLRLYVAAWLGIGIVMGVLMILATGQNWRFAMGFSVPMALFYGFVALSAYYLCRSFPIEGRKMLQSLLVLGAVSVVSSALWVGAGRGWWWVINQVTGFGAFDAPLGATDVLFFGSGIMLYALSATAYYLFLESERGREREHRIMEAKLEARAAELRALRAQIDPHFFFNSLNSISAMITRNPVGARKMALLLAEFLRTTLRVGSQKSISLKEEIDLVSAFLDIEKTRFDDRLHVVLDRDPAADGCPVPPLILQPLVENAIKHGIAELVSGGTVLIRSKLHGSLLRLVVENPTDEAPVTTQAGAPVTTQAGAPVTTQAGAPATTRSGAPNKGGANLGIQNVKSRLAALYGDDARLDISARLGQYRAELTLPVVEVYQ